MKKKYIILDSHLSYGYIEALSIGVSNDGTEFCVGERINTDQYHKEVFDNLWEALEYYHIQIDKRMGR